MCMMGDEDYWEFYNEFHPTARKDHRCCECRRTITKGERYWTQGGLHEAGFVWNKTCEHCNAAADWLLAVCEGWIFTRRLEDFMDHVTGHEKYIRTKSLVRIVRWMRAGWRDRTGALRPLVAVEALTHQAIVEHRNLARAA